MIIRKIRINQNWVNFIDDRRIWFLNLWNNIWFIIKLEYISKKFLKFLKMNLVSYQYIRFCINQIIYRVDRVRLISSCNSWYYSEMLKNTSNEF